MKGAAITAVLLLVFFAIVSLFFTVSPDAGHEVVLIDKPYLFGSGGVLPEPVKTGRTFVAISTQAVDVSMQPQQFEVVFKDLMTSDGVPLGFDSVIRLRVTDSVALISKFGKDWYANNVEKEFMNRVRQAVRKHGMNETAISSVAIDAIDDEVGLKMEEYLQKTGLPVVLIKVTVGKANPPDSIKSQRVETAKEQQRQQTELQRKLAEDNRKGAEESRAAADNAYREKMGLNPEQFIELSRINMQRAVCDNGKCTFILGGGVTPVMNLH